jgi:Transposase DDE domain
MVRDKTTQMWRISKDKREYDNFHNLVNGHLKNTVDVEKLNESLLINQVDAVKGKASISIIYDGSDIRKGESSSLENLGWVKDLKGIWVRGYNTFNAVRVERGEVGLLSCVPYSNRDPHFLSEKERKQFESGKLLDKARQKEIELYLEDEDMYNQKQIYKSTIKSVHDNFKSVNEDAVLNHILDRGHDDNELFKFIDDLGDKFTIRLKNNRNSPFQTLDEKTQKEKFLKWSEIDLGNRAEKCYEKVAFKKRVYVKPRALFEWDNIVIENRQYCIVRVRFYTYDGQPIFKEPMFIITNHEVNDAQMAQFVYQLYLQRSKIEGVFKFLKDVLGWETFKVQDFESIKNIIALCFFVGAYFYDIQDELTKDDNIQWICELGGGKGTVSRYFFLKGLEKLLIAQQVELFKQEFNISKEQIDYAFDLII